MTQIYGISSNFLQAYVNFQSKDKLTIEEMFRRLSLEMGGDGEKITKDQLDEYVNKIEAGKIKASKEKIYALKYMQKNWDEISGGKDVITMGDMEKYSTILALAMTSTFETEEIEVKDEDKKTPYELLLENMEISDFAQATGSELNEYLKTLIAEDSDDDAIADAIDAIINIIAEKESFSTISAQA